jgi:hypothetical protein
MCYRFLQATVRYLRTGKLASHAATHAIQPSTEER